MGLLWGDCYFLFNRYFAVTILCASEYSLSFVRKNVSLLVTVLVTHKQELRVMEINTLRWMCGLTLKDCTRIYRIQGSLRVRDSADKLQESGLCFAETE